ncbi:MAG: saccharopine dehydrogenase family protein, partial [Candidatus Natronoplasma sp.]
CYPNGNGLKYADRLEVEDLKDMGRYTCRWEGHSDFWRTMVKSGFLDEEPVEVDGDMMSPMRFVAELLKSQDQFWLKDDEKDLAMVRVEARGIKDGEEVRNVYQMIDRRDLETGFTAMQRTVGYTASIGAHLILEGELDRNGILSPTEVDLSKIVGELEERDISIEHDIDCREE